MINRQNQHWQLANRPELDWSGDTPRSRQFNDIYFSDKDGPGESRYVFIEGSEFSERVQALNPGEQLTLAETGFGTGLNFLLTIESWCTWRQHGGASTRLHYIGIDNWPMSKQQLEQVFAGRGDLTPLAQRLLADWPSAVRGCHRIHWDDWGVTLDLWWEDAEEVLEDLASRNRRLVDIWYLDGFAPARDQAMWSKQLFTHLACLSNPDASLATFTAASDVRRGLIDAGFEVNKRKGFGRKRECLSARYPAAACIEVKPPSTTPWDLNPTTVAVPSRDPMSSHAVDTVVLGAGLAGATAARSLAMRGIAVTVIERNQVACGGSSNLQGLTYTRLSRRFAPLADFALTSYSYATRRYRQMLHRQDDASGPLVGASCGYLQASDDHKTLDYLEEILGAEGSPVQILDADAASDVLGIAQQQRCLYFPEAMWLNPPSVCHAMLDHPLITVLEQVGSPNIRRQDGEWRVSFDRSAQQQPPAGGAQSVSASTLILATAHGIGSFPETSWLPLQAIRGQTTHVKATAISKTLQTAFCHEGYLPPAWNGIHCMGASYGPNDTSLDERLEDHNHNLSTLNALLPNLGFPQNGGDTTGHVALRCTTADYLPIVGPVPDRAVFNRTYADLSKQKSRLIPQDCPVIPGLWVIGGLGSRGLTAAPLAAELLASELLGEPAPVPRYLQQAISPARFLARGLIRGAPL